MSTTNRFTFPGTALTVNRVGYGAMQLAGPGVWGPPRNPDGAIAVLRAASAAGVNHIDTSDYYGPHVTNQMIKQALHPYTKALFAASLPSHPDEPRAEIVLTGEVPSALDPPRGCHFHPRCPFVMPRCSEQEPDLVELSPGHRVACHLYP